jgi:hypothetical protein
MHFEVLEDYAHYRRSEATLVSAATQDVTGRAARDIDTFARDYAPSFASASS